LLQIIFIVQTKHALRQSPHVAIFRINRFRITGKFKGFAAKPISGTPAPPSVCALSCFPLFLCVICGNINFQTEQADTHRKEYGHNCQVISLFKPHKDAAEKIALLSSLPYRTSSDISVPAGAN